MTRTAYSLPENELIELYKATMIHCAKTIETNVGGSDDSLDYIDSALDIAAQLHDAYIADGNDDNWVVLRDAFRNLIDDADPYATFASDAIPAEWEVFLDGE